MLIYINGKFYPREEAKVSVFDHGYLYGDGIYETLRSYEGMVFKFEEHISRLFHSAEMMRMRLPLDKDGIMSSVHDTLRVNNLSDAYIRMSVSRGPGEIGLDPELCPEPTFVIIASQFHDYPTEFYEQGVNIAVVKTRRNHPLSINPAIKATNFLNNIFAKIEAKEAGGFEGIMLNLDGFVAEGTISNIFFIKKGELCTPPVTAGILEGVTRDLVIKLAGGLGMQVSEELFDASGLKSADEVFITNTTLEIMPVRSIDGEAVGTGKPGEITRKIGAAYKEEVRLCLKAR